MERTDPAHLHKYTLRQPVPTEIYVERHITQAQFSFIVKRLIHLIRQGQHPEDIIHLFDSNQQYLQAGASDEDSDEWEGEAKNAFDEARQPATGLLDADGDGDTGYQEGSGDEAQAILQHARNTRMSQRRQKETRSKSSISNRRPVSEQEQFLHGQKRMCGQNR